MTFLVQKKDGVPFFNSQKFYSEMTFSMLESDK